MNEWISINDKLPKSGQDVLVYWWDEPFEVHQIHVVTFWRKGDVIDESLTELITGKERKLLAPKDGFYIYTGEDSKPWRQHADLITHWMPLPSPPMIEGV